MTASIRSTLIVLCAALVLCISAWLYWSSSSAAKIFAECHKTNPDTPAAYEIYSECMKSYGLDPKDWE